MRTDPGYESVPACPVRPVVLPRSSCARRFKKPAQLRRRPELWNGIELLEDRCKRVRQAPHGSGFKLLMLWSEIEFVHAPRQVFWDLQIPLNECPVDRQLCRRYGQLLGSPAFHLPPHRLEVTLHPINTN